MDDKIFILCSDGIILSLLLGGKVTVSPKKSSVRKLFVGGDEGEEMDENDNVWNEVGSMEDNDDDNDARRRRR